MSDLQAARARAEALIPRLTDHIDGSGADAAMCLEHAAARTIRALLDALDEKEKEAAALREQLRAYGHSPEEYTSEGHAAAHRCEYDSGHILHGMPSLCAPCRVELEKVKEAAEERLRELEAALDRIMVKEFHARGIDPTPPGVLYNALREIGNIARDALAQPTEGEPE